MGTLVLRLGHWTPVPVKLVSPVGLGRVTSWTSQSGSLDDRQRNVTDSLIALPCDLRNVKTLVIIIQATAAIPNSCDVVQMKQLIMICVQDIQYSEVSESVDNVLYTGYSIQ